MQASESGPHENGDSTIKHGEITLFNDQTRGFSSRSFNMDNFKPRNGKSTIFFDEFPIKTTEVCFRENKVPQNLMVYHKILYHKNHF